MGILLDMGSGKELIILGKSINERERVCVCVCDWVGVFRLIIKYN